MRAIILVLLFIGLISCKKTNSAADFLVGAWGSTKVDTLVQYIKPVKPDGFKSVDYRNSSIQIKGDGSFQMINSKDTIIGTWNLSKPDSLIVTTNIIRGKYYYDSKIEFVDRNNLIVAYRCGHVYYGVGCGYTEEEHLMYDIKTHYIRIDQDRTDK